jgi:hypothetical protein
MCRFRAGIGDEQKPAGSGGANDRMAALARDTVRRSPDAIRIEERVLSLVRRDIMLFDVVDIGGIPVKQPDALPCMSQNMLSQLRAPDRASMGRRGTCASSKHCLWSTRTSTCAHRRHTAGMNHDRRGEPRLEETKRISRVLKLICVALHRNAISGRRIHMARRGGELTSVIEFEYARYHE